MHSSGGVWQPEIAALQDLLLYALMGLSKVATEGRKLSVIDRETNIFTIKEVFSTLTNVDFDPDRFVGLIYKTVTLREQLKRKVKDAGGNISFSDELATFQPLTALEGLIQQGENVGLKSYPGDNPDILSLKHTVLFGIKEVSAYADHALILGKEDDKVFSYIHEALAAIQCKNMELSEWVNMALRCGEAALLAMELLDAGNTSTYGHPTPTIVPLGHKKGRAILVSGHDLMDLEEILKQS